MLSRAGRHVDNSHSIVIIVGIEGGSAQEDVVNGAYVFADWSS